MNAIYNCVVIRHDSLLLFLAALICLFASASALWTIRHGLAAPSNRRGWYLVAALIVGFGIWATHYVAMLAYASRTSIQIDPLMTLLSIAIASGITGLALAMIGHDRRAAILAGIVLGCGIVVMHFTGMLGVRPMGQIVWNDGLVAVSIASGVGLSAIAMPLGLRHGRRSKILASIMLAMAICSLHLIAMAAAHFEPDPGFMPAEADPFRYWLAGLIFVAFIALAGFVGYLMLIERAEWRRQGELGRLRELVDAAMEGLLVTDSDMIVAANASFQRLVGWNEDELVGTRLGAILKDALRQGFTASDDRGGDAVIEDRKGEQIPVEVLSRSINFAGKPCRTIAVRDLRGRRQAEERIHYLALHDPLTGLWNRTSFAEQLEREIERHRRNGSRFALLYMDLDRFKQINDFSGHEIGDQVLRDLAHRLGHRLRASELLARLGGDEFALLCYDTESVAQVAAVAERVLEIVQYDVSTAPQAYQLSVSIGISMYPDDGDDMASLMRNADTALYRAKQEGRCIYRFFDQAMGDKWRERQELERDLRLAIQADELRLVYQPQARVEDGQILGFEALARWEHPERGSVPPDLFIRVAEETGLIVPLGAWALRNACREAARWRSVLSVAVNVSAVQLCRADFVDMVLDVLDETGLDPARLELEVTETALVHDFDLTIRTLRALKEVGVRIAMDDFGTGYSSLSNLRSFPFDKIKIDRSFVTSVDRSEQGAMIVRTIVGLARGLGLPVIAEGVETGNELKFLCAEMCDGVQGYLIGRPAAIDTFARLTGVDVDEPTAAVAA